MGRGCHSFIGFACSPSAQTAREHGSECLTCDELSEDGSRWDGCNLCWRECNDIVQEFQYYQLPAVANDKTCEFITKWYGGQSMDYKMLISTDLPFWRSNKSNGSYSLSSKIDIE